MGSFAPRHVQMADEGFQPPPPYQLVDNENSLIDVTDLVFVDAIDTGFSRVDARAWTTRSSTARTATSARSASSSPST